MHVHIHVYACTYARSTIYIIIYVLTIRANEWSNDAWLVDLVRGLSERGVEIRPVGRDKTGGTARALRAAGLVPEPSRRCTDGCGNGRCDWAGTGPPRWVPLDPEQALDTWQRLGITFDLFTTTHGESHRSRGWLVAGALADAGAVLVGVYKINASNAMPKSYLTVYIYTYERACARTNAHAVDREQYSQTQINARKFTIAIDAWAFSACKRDCVLRVRSKTFRMYYMCSQSLYMSVIVRI